MPLVHDPSAPRTKRNRFFVDWYVPGSGVNMGRVLDTVGIDTDWECVKGVDLATAVKCLSANDFDEGHLLIIRREREHIDD